MITTSNYTQQAKNLNFSKAPAAIKAGHEAFTELNQFYNDDADIKETIDLYLKELNKWVNKQKPKAGKKSKPVKSKLEHLIADYRKEASKERKEYEAPAKGEHTYKLGDMYRSDFDYWGMLTVAVAITEETSLTILQKLYDSMEDVNFHSLNRLLDPIIKLKANSPQIPHKKEKNATKTTAKSSSKGKSNSPKKKPPLAKYSAGDFVKTDGYGWIMVVAESPKWNPKINDWVYQLENWPDSPKKGNPGTYNENGISIYLKSPKEKTQPKSNIKNQKSKVSPCPEPKPRKSTPAKGKKKEYGEGYPQGVKVRSISDDARLLKRINLAIGKQRKLSTLANLYNTFAKYVAENKITKTSTHARLILEATNKLRELITKASQKKIPQDDHIVFDLSDKELKEDIATAAKGTKAYPSINLFKRFANMQGKMNVGMAGRRSNLIKAIESAYKNKRVVAKDPFAKELKKILTILKNTPDNQVIPPLEVGLGSVDTANGLAGIMGYLGCPGYEGGQCPCSKKNEGLSGIDIPNPKEALETARSMAEAAKGYTQLPGQIADIAKVVTEPLDSTVFSKFVNGDQLDNLKPKGEVIELPGELGRFFGPIEDYQMVVILRGDRGAGKTRLTFQLADAFTSMGKSVLYNTLEIGLYSDLIKRMKNEYVQPHNQNRITWNEERLTFDELNAAADKFDVVFVDSYGKLKDMNRDSIDELKKNNPNTIFVFIFQSNSKGTSLGGPGSEYDGGTVVHVVTVPEDKSLNYAKMEKNRYSGDALYYQVFQKRTITHEELDVVLNPKNSTEPTGDNCDE